ncbi:MAG: hypothetical protein ABSD89_14570 [Halobacteriota archaeon]
MTNIPATHDPRTDAQILADKDKNKDLERGTVRDANGVPRDMRQFPAAPVESYSQYLARVSGLTDFTPLTEAQWRKETGQKTAEETILADLGITPRPIVEVKVPLDTPVLDGTIPTIPLTKELDIAEYFPKELVERATVPDIVLREMNSKCPVPSRMQGDIGVMPTVPVAQELKTSLDKAMQGIEDLINTPAQEAEARHTAAHLPAVDSIKLEL